MAVAQVSLNFLGRSNCAAQTLAAASPRILGATPRSVCGSPGASPRSFVGVNTPKTPARSPFSTNSGCASPFFGAASPVWNEFEMAARASAEASAQLARVALPSAMSARQHYLARMARRGSNTSLDCSSHDNSGNGNGNSNINTHSNSNNNNSIASSAGSLSLLGAPNGKPSDAPSRLGLGLGLRGPSLGPSPSLGSPDLEEANLPVMLGNTRRQPTQVLRKLYMQEEETASVVDDTAKAAALVRENFMRRRAIIAGRSALMAMPMVA